VDHDAGPLPWGWLPCSCVTASDLRKSLKHTAFIEPNRQAVVETVYGDGE
jgi:hypothetical protein